MISNPYQPYFDDPSSGGALESHGVWELQHRVVGLLRELGACQKDLREDEHRSSRRAEKAEQAKRSAEAESVALRKRLALCASAQKETQGELEVAGEREAELTQDLDKVKHEENLCNERFAEKRSEVSELDREVEELAESLAREREARDRAENLVSLDVTKTIAEVEESQEREAELSEELIQQQAEIRWEREEMARERESRASERESARDRVAEQGEVRWAEILEEQQAQRLTEEELETRERGVWREEYRAQAWQEARWRTEVEEAKVWGRRQVAEEIAQSSQRQALARYWNLEVEEARSLREEADAAREAVTLEASETRIALGRLRRMVEETEDSRHEDQQETVAASEVAASAREERSLLRGRSRRFSEVCAEDEEARRAVVAEAEAATLHLERLRKEAPEKGDEELFSLDAERGVSATGMMTPMEDQSLVPARQEEEGGSVAAVAPEREKETETEDQMDDEKGGSE